MRLRAKGERLKVLKILLPLALRLLPVAIRHAGEKQRRLV